MAGHLNDPATDGEVDFEERALSAASRLRRAETMRLVIDSEPDTISPAFDLSVASTLLNNGFGKADLLRVLGYVPDAVKDRV